MLTCTKHCGGFCRISLTPHGIQAGRGDSTHDVLLMRDPNGLPCIPATSLAGVLRHLHARQFDKAAENNLFGYAQGNQGQPSWVHFTAALVHDRQNKPVEGLRNDISKDPVLDFLAQSKPLVRQRVRLNARGAAAETGKFDTTLIPAGTRYSTFIGYWSDGSPEAETAWNQLLGLLGSRGFRLGHGTRSGSGAFQVNHLQAERWDLRTPEGQQGFCQRSRQRANPKGLKTQTLQASPGSSLTVELPLQAEAGWRVGGGEHSLIPANGAERTPHLLPQSEKRIVWQQNQASIQDHMDHMDHMDHIAVLPASAVKGALAHRFAFHYRCLGNEFVNAQEPVTLEPNNDCPGIRAVFGYVTETRPDQTEVAQVGQLLIDDLYLENPRTARQMHNRIDRFTGGVIDGALFEEELLWQTSLTLKLTLLAPEKLDDRCKQALSLTLQDLAQGWLPLGASGSRGQGVFVGTGEMTWSDPQAWTQNQEEECA